MPSVSFWSAVCANVAFWLASLLNYGADRLAVSASTSGTGTGSSSSTAGRRTKATTLGQRLLQSKLQASVVLSNDAYKQIFSLAFLNMVIVTFGICVPMFEGLWDYLHGSDRQLDSWMWQRELLRLSLCPLLTEITFYTCHRLLHTPYLYERIHKVHHTFRAPCAMAAAYAHPMEFVFGNVACIAIGPILLNLHPHSSYFYFASALLSTCKGHCGYNIMNAATHDQHHQCTVYNFGVLHLCDHVLGTSSDSFRFKTKKTKTVFN